MAWSRHHPGRRARVSALEALTRLSRALLAWVVAGVAASCATTARVPLVDTPRIDLAVVTFNMHVGRGDLPRLLDDLAAGRLTATPPSNYLVLLQEALDSGPHDPVSVARNYQLSVAFEPVRRRGSRMSGNAILATLPIADVRQIELPRERQPRKAIIAVVSVAGERLFVATTQLENRVSIWRGLLFSDGPRGRQARALIAQLPDGHGIAGGDLNTWLGPEEPAWKAFAARFPNTPSEPAGPTVMGRLAIDHLFYDLPAGWRVTRRVVPDAYGSDHQPVVAAISLAF